MDIQPATVIATAATAKPSRADVLAGMAKVEAEAAAADKDAAPAAKSAAGADDAVKADDAAPAKKADPIVADDADDPDAEPKVEAKPGEKTDPETDKRLSLVQKAEKRSRDAIAEAKREASQAIATERQRLDPLLEKTKAYESAVANARTNPVALLRALGVTDDEMEYVARQAYAESTAAQKKPENREAAARQRAEREHASELATLRKTVEELQGGLTKREQEAAAARDGERYIAGVTKAVVDADAPIVARMLEKTPQKAQNLLMQTALMMLNRDGEVPDHAEVIAELERNERAELADRGVDVDAIVKAKPAAATVVATPAAKPARTLDTSTASTTRPIDNSKKTAAEKRAELEKNMPWRDSA